MKYGVFLLLGLTTIATGTSERWTQVQVTGTSGAALPGYTTHAVLLPGGEVLSIEAGYSPYPGISSTPNPFLLIPGDKLDYCNASTPRVPLSGVPIQPGMKRNHRNLFCAAHLLMPDSSGSVLFVGGDDNDADPSSAVHTNQPNSGATCLVMFRPGSKYDVSYNPWLQFVEEPAPGPWPQNPENFQSLPEGRWYPTLVQAGIGRYVAVGGSGELGPGQKVNSMVSLAVAAVDGKFVPSARLSEVPYVGVGAGAARQQLSKYYPGIYPVKNSVNGNDVRDHDWIVVGQSQRVLRLPLATLLTRGHFGENDSTNWGNPSFPQSAFNLPTGPVYPASAFMDGKILISGGSNYIFAVPGWALIDTTTHVPTYSAGGFPNEIVPTHRMLVPRQNHALVVLPNGKFMAIGGHVDGTTSYSTASIPAQGPAAADKPYGTGESWAHNRPEFFDPETKQWSMPEDASHVLPTPIRPYHMSALLLPTGEVLVGGGDPSTTVGSASSLALQRTSFVYRPDYIPTDERLRPTIQLESGRNNADIVFYGERAIANITLGGSDRRIRRLMMVSLGSMTHSYDAGQRAFTVQHQLVNSPGTRISEASRGVQHVQFRIDDPWYRQPGWYMLFVEDSKGHVSRAATFRLLDRFGIDAPSSVSYRADGVWVDPADSNPLTAITLGDAVYSESTVPNAALGGSFVTFQPGLNVSRVVTSTGNGTTPPAIRVETGVSGAGPISGMPIKIRLESRISGVPAGIVPEFRVLDHGDMQWKPAPITEMGTPTTQLILGGETYREYIVRPSATDILSSLGKLSVEVTFPGAQAAFIDMIQVGLFQPVIRY